METNPILYYSRRHPFLISCRPCAGVNSSMFTYRAEILIYRPTLLHFNMLVFHSWVLLITTNDCILRKHLIFSFVMYNISFQIKINTRRYLPTSCTLHWIVIPSAHNVITELLLIRSVKNVHCIICKLPEKTVSSFLFAKKQFIPT